MNGRGTVASFDVPIDPLKEQIRELLVVSILHQQVTIAFDA